MREVTIKFMDSECKEFLENIRERLLGTARLVDVRVGDRPITLDTQMEITNQLRLTLTLIERKLYE